MSASVIQILDQTTANKIAAGEVVERPSSVIKELVENSLDANSRHITVEIQEGGLSYIRVSDDGIGMSPADAQLAILRHATSKIKSAEDLHRIGSLGFRGEALPSIASVSRFALTTRQADEEMGTYVEVAGGSLTDCRETGAGVGTSISVCDLFFNTPARRKFLKTISTESGYIHSILGKIALSRPDVAFKLINNGRQVLDTPGNGKLLDAIAALYGNSVLDAMLPVCYEDQGFSIGGFVGKPTLLKSSRQWQTYIINQRVVNSRIIAKALDSAYHSLLPKAGYPLAVLTVHIPLDHIDVNVHPQKSEVKFSDDQAIYRIIYRSVTGTIQNPESLTVVAAAHPTHSGQPTYFKRPPQPIQRDYTMPDCSVWRENTLPFQSVKEELAKVDAAAASLPYSNTPEFYTLTEKEETAAEVLRPIGQVADCYIIATGLDGLYIVDQHAAHERILFDRLTAAADKIPRQTLLIPLFWEFDPLEMALIEQNIEQFHALGLILDVIGPTTIRVTELPADLQISDAEPAIRECLALVQESKKPTPDTLRLNFYQVAACRGAIKAGDPLNMRQSQALLDELCATQLPYTCPHGRPAIIKFTRQDLEKMFKRT